MTSLPACTPGRYVHTPPGCIVMAHLLATTRRFPAASGGETSIAAWPSSATVRFAADKARVREAHGRPRTHAALRQHHADRRSGWLCGRRLHVEFRRPGR